MIFPVNIAKNLRLLLTAITLLLVVGLNNREVTTYAVSDTATSHQLNKSAAEHNGTVKQKVTLEATSSYLILPLAALPAILPRLDFPQPLLAIKVFYPAAVAVAGFFKIFLSAAIQPNAP